MPNNVRFSLSIGGTTHAFYNYYGERKIELVTLNTIFEVGSRGVPSPKSQVS